MVKYYERATHCHTNVLECLNGILVEQFLVQQCDDIAFVNLLEESMAKTKNLIQLPSKYIAEELMPVEHCFAYISELIDYKQTERRRCRMGKPLNPGLCLVLNLICAVKNSDFKLYAECMPLTVYLFLSDGQLCQLSDFLFGICDTSRRIP